MKPRKLTDRFIKSIKASKPGRRDDYRDSVVPGLAVRVTANAHKSFVLHARFPRSPKVFTRRILGEFIPDDQPSDDAVGLAPSPATLRQARQRARLWQHLVAAGIDPEWRIEEQRRAQAVLRANTFGQVAECFLTGPAARWAAAKDARSVFKRVFLPLWRERPIAEITAPEVSAAVASIARRAPSAAFNAFGYLRVLFNWAIGTGSYGLSASPMDRLKPRAVIGRPKALRTTVLTDIELRAVWTAAGAMAYPVGTVIALLILTGQRLSMVAEMQWSEVDVAEKLWLIPASRMKARSAHEVPLTPVALAILEALPRWTGGDFVFSNTNGKKSVSGFGKAKLRIDKLIAGHAGDIKAWVFHDLRRTMRTHLSALPVQDMVRELTIAHTQKGLHKVYDQHTYREEKRHCLELWEARLDAIVNPKTADIAEARAKRGG